MGRAPKSAARILRSRILKIPSKTALIAGPLMPRIRVINTTQRAARPLSAASRPAAGAMRDFHPERAGGGSRGRDCGIELRSVGRDGTDSSGATVAVTTINANAVSQRTSIAGVTEPGHPARVAPCQRHEISRWRGADRRGTSPPGAGAASGGRRPGSLGYASCITRLARRARLTAGCEHSSHMRRLAHARGLALARHLQ
jgi:hypothetical protein